MSNTPKRISLLLLLGAATGVACEPPCGPGDADCRLSADEWALVQTMSPLPAPPVDPTNRYQFNEAAAVFGQKIFYEKRYSGPIKVVDNGSNGGISTSTEPGQISCASCHDSARGFVDTRSKPGNIALAAGYTGRNSPTMLNLPYYKWWGWGGRHDSMWQQASLAIETPTDTAADRCNFAHFVWEHYKDEYNAVFVDTPLPAELDPAHPNASRFPPKCKPKGAGAPDGPWEAMSAEDRKPIMQIIANQGKAVVAFETKLVMKNAPFDKWVAGDEEAISAAAKRGLRLFIGKAACVDCHNGPNFSDSEFHNIGIPQEGLNVPKVEQGRFADITIYKNHPFNSSSAFNDAPEMNRAKDFPGPTDDDRGKFRTQTLRNIALTYPYMHTGNFETLAEVVAFYNQGGGGSGFVGTKSTRLQPLNMTDDEMSDLVAFLQTLTGEPLAPELLANPLN